MWSRHQLKSPLHLVRETVVTAVDWSDTLPLVVTFIDLMVTVGTSVMVPTVPAKFRSSPDVGNFPLLQLATFVHDPPPAGTQLTLPDHAIPVNPKHSR